jgi:hypothetical protein
MTMTRRRITINAYSLLECGPRSYSISCDLTGKSPSKAVEIDTLSDCKLALRAFAAELEGTDKPWHLSISFDKKSGRRPAGFEKAQTARELECHVNPHLAVQRAA